MQVTPETVPGLFTNGLRCFEEILPWLDQSLELSESPILEAAYEECTRFRIWGLQNGVSSSDDTCASLGERLKEQPEVEQLVLEILHDANSTLSKIMQEIKEHRSDSFVRTSELETDSDTSVSSDSTSTSILMGHLKRLFENVAELYTLQTLLRTPSMKIQHPHSTQSSVVVPIYQPDNEGVKSTSDDLKQTFSPASARGENPGNRKPNTYLPKWNEAPVASPTTQWPLSQHSASTDMYSDEVPKKLLAEQKSNNRHLVRSDTTAVGDYQVFHWIGDSVFLEPPSWEQGDKTYFLKGHRRISSVSEYTKYHPKIAFAVLRIYSENAQPPKGFANIHGTLPSPKPSKEYVKFIAPEMISAMQRFLISIPNFDDQLLESNMYDEERFGPTGEPLAQSVAPTLVSTSKLDDEIPRPYLFWFFCRSQANEAIGKLQRHDAFLITIFRDWIETAYGPLWKTVNSEFAKGLVSPQSIQYLIRPGDVLVSQKGSVIESYIATSWLFQHPTEKPDHQNIMIKYSVECWCWDDNGIRKRHTTRGLRISTSSRYTSIKTLEVSPLWSRHVKLQRQLEKRGRTFCECRKGKLVSYAKEGVDEVNMANDKFIIDAATYRMFQRRVPFANQGMYSYSRMLQSNIEDEPDELADSYEEPPKQPLLLVFPRQVTAFDLKRNLWTKIEVDNIREVTWDQSSFDKLALQRDSKELIEALVTSQIDASEGTDIVAGKGNGLIMLLHGGPGTGKTFTAESIAELAHKPLFRVTCSGIGTKPEEAEPYLELVFYLRKKWDCIVLLDEADVFLEQRGRYDLTRNAMVSVFLKIMEYHQGILLLTSNRPGLFDEAFKSRIQLSLRYPDLTEEYRYLIWSNFIDRLESFSDPKISCQNLRNHLNPLAAIEMNGRQIRNVITNARQLAKFRNKYLDYDLLRHVMEMSMEFEVYTRAVNEDITDQERARGEGWR
ncbi:AAA family ATPase [Apiospora marii]|uniref:AAA family ATPase n=1 Tax=Apiospora marii TaxID=335849 RepID=A0ABR1SRV0_9PEZI